MEMHKGTGFLKQTMIFFIPFQHHVIDFYISLDFKNIGIRTVFGKKSVPLLFSIKIIAGQLLPFLTFMIVTTDWPS